MTSTNSGDIHAHGAGAMLAAARLASGLSIDAVAQQLKLSPRQVRAIEGDEYGLLPGRTFVRGFVRNYARLLRLDAERVLDALPSGEATPTLEAPTLNPTAPSMGELPTTEATKAPWTRWAIPVSLAAIVAVAAFYEWSRPAAASRHSPAKEASAPAEGPTAPPTSDKSETPLPNPLAGGAPVPTAPKEDATPSSAVPAPSVAPSSPEPAPTNGAARAP